MEGYGNENPGAFQSTRPLRGATGHTLSSSTRTNNFNPRTHCGARPARQEHRQRPQRFQPTRPLRGATIQRLHSQRAVLISTHAPLAGRDAAERIKAQKKENISTHAPLAGRDQGLSSACVSFELISTHAPLAGRDVRFGHALNRREISTHAPLAGRDDNAPWYWHQPCYFNPRAPCGARPLAMAVMTGAEIFQPTRPLRGATGVVEKEAGARQIFQPTRPLRGATDSWLLISERQRISTHAPLAGRDCISASAGERTHGISTHAPLAGRDRRCKASNIVNIEISTHAPLAGRDVKARL